MRQNSIGLLAAVAAAGMVGAAYPIRRDEQVLVIDGGDDWPRIKSTAPEATKEVTQADLDRIEAAQRRRALKISRQAKGFRP